MIGFSFYFIKVKFIVILKPMIINHWLLLFIKDTFSEIIKTDI